MPSKLIKTLSALKPFKLTLISIIFVGTIPLGKTSIVRDLFSPIKTLQDDSEI
jgi:hypothetical protein